MTAQAALGPFADPAIVAAARTSEIDLDWLLSGENTVYICSPLKDQARLAPAFGGLVNDLMIQIYERANLAPGAGWTSGCWWCSTRRATSASRICPSTRRRLPAWACSW